MGTWGTGNFDSDTAADHLGLVVEPLLAAIASAMSGDPGQLEPDEYDGVAVPCNVELLALLCEQRWVGITLPPPDTIAAWKQKYLAVFDATIDGLAPSAAWRKARRAVLVATFDRLAKASQREAGAATPPPAAPARKRTAKRGKPRRKPASSPKRK